MGQGFCAFLSQLNSSLHPFPQAPDGLVSAHVPDREAEEDAGSEPAGTRGHSGSHPQGREIGRRRAAAHRVQSRLFVPFLQRERSEQM